MDKILFRIGFILGSNLFSYIYAIKENIYEEEYSLLFFPPTPLLLLNNNDDDCNIFQTWHSGNNRKGHKEAMRKYKK